MTEPLIIAVDFDGTLCEEKHPHIGKPNRELIKWLLHAQKQGVILILWTCRTGKFLKDAIEWCHNQGLYFDAYNENHISKIVKYGGDTRKVSADIYIDDKSINPHKMIIKDGKLL